MPGVSEPACRWGAAIALGVAVVELSRQRADERRTGQLTMSFMSAPRLGHEPEVPRSKTPIGVAGSGYWFSIID